MQNIQDNAVDVLTINGIEYVRKYKSNKNIKIVILQRGWDMVGIFERSENYCTLTNASVIRKWGTTHGLGELAAKGPLKNTILDKCGTVQFDYLTVVAAIDCDEEIWKNKL